MNAHHILKILTSGAGWLAVDKPAGMSVHNDPGRDLCTLCAARLMADDLLKAGIKPDTDFGVHAVHRLDRDTSGVVLLAARREALRFLAAQFEKRTVSKRYVAILHGIMVPPSGSAWGMWRWPLTKNAAGRRDPAGRGQRKACQTRFRVLATSSHYTQVECAPETGRKHQIRRHAKLAGHPVVGDRRYGSRRSLVYLQEKCGFSRLGLHARALTFLPPDGDKSLTVQASEMPTEFKRLLEMDKV
jgi:RluA family pseudouridine synthase